jgi:hypothetical protein
MSHNICSCSKVGPRSSGELSGRARSGSGLLPRSLPVSPPVPLLDADGRGQRIALQYGASLVDHRRDGQGAARRSGRAGAGAVGQLCLARLAPCRCAIEYAPTSESATIYPGRDTRRRDRRALIHSAGMAKAGTLWLLSQARVAQCVVTSLPLSRPVSARINAPVQTEAILRFLRVVTAAASRARADRT